MTEQESYRIKNEITKAIEANKIITIKDLTSRIVQELYESDIADCHLVCRLVEKVAEDMIQARRE